MKECSKSIQRRLADSRFVRQYFVGWGLDIGGKPDPLNLYKELFPLIKGIRTWDWEDGDAQYLSSIGDGSLDFVHSSHCLEHLVDPIEGLKNWVRTIREGGHLIVTVPDEDLYEQGLFPSTFNRDHKWSFTIYKVKSWSSRSINVIDLLRELSPSIEIIKVEQLSATYRYELPRYDQTLTPIGECGIEVIARKSLHSDIESAGRWKREVNQVERELKLHLNQYKDDVQTLKSANAVRPPFSNDSEI